MGTNILDGKRGNAMQIDVERLVNDPHRSATHLGRFTAFARHQFLLPTKDWAVDRRQSLERATRRAPDEKGALYAVGMCTASSYS